MLNSRDNDGFRVYVGVAPFDVDQNAGASPYECGWYLNCHESVLYSGPPHNYVYWHRAYGLRKDDGEYVHNGDSVGVVMNTAKGNLSFVLDGVDFGVAYEGIPLDKPLVPCVLLQNEGDSVELDLSPVEENVVDSTIPAPSNVAVGGTTWDSITLTWGAVGGASLYQIEANGGKTRNASTADAGIRLKLPTNIELSFRVRTVRGTSFSEWSGVVKGMIPSTADFRDSEWAQCPSYVGDLAEYGVLTESPKVAKKYGCEGYPHCCTVIGNTPLPPNQVVSWRINLLNSFDNNGRGFWIGVAPHGINQDDDENYNKCGWYFDCYTSSLYSGYPHSYRGKEYGPRKENGQYVRNGDSVGVVMDTERGELSFTLKNVNLGLAYEGILVDEPLVPCVILGGWWDAVALDILKR